jgi:hypothetical protein
VGHGSLEDLDSGLDNFILVKSDDLITLFEIIRDPKSRHMKFNKRGILTI